LRKGIIRVADANRLHELPLRSSRIFLKRELGERVGQRIPHGAVLSHQILVQEALVQTLPDLSFIEMLSNENELLHAVTKSRVPIGQLIRALPFLMRPVLTRDSRPPKC